MDIGFFSLKIIYARSVNSDGLGVYLSQLPMQDRFTYIY